MPRTWFHDWVDDAREQYGLSWHEALDLYHDLREQGFERGDFEELVAEEAVEEEPDFAWFYEQTDYGYEYDIEDMFDLYIDAGEELEITVEYEG